MLHFHVSPWQSQRCRTPGDNLGKCPRRSYTSGRDVCAARVGSWCLTEWGTDSPQQRAAKLCTYKGIQRITKSAARLWRWPGLTPLKAAPNGNIIVFPAYFICIRVFFPFSRPYLISRERYGYSHVIFICWADLKKKKSLVSVCKSLAFLFPETKSILR